MLKLYVYSQMRFDLKTYNLGVTWIDENLDAIVVRYIRKWLEMPISACVKEMMTLPKQNGGLAIPSLVNLFESEWLRKRSVLKSSRNIDIGKVWTETSSKHVSSDSI